MRGRHRRMARAGVVLSGLLVATLGAGVDFALTDRWFTRAEYAYTGYVRANHEVDLAPSRVITDHHELRFGIGYKL